MRSRETERERKRERERRVANDTSIIYAHRQSDFNLAISSLSLSACRPLSRGLRTVNNLAKWHNTLWAAPRREVPKVTAAVTKMEGVFVCRSHRPVGRSSTAQRGEGNSGQGRGGYSFRTGMRRTSEGTGWELRYAKRREREGEAGEGSSGIKCK